MATRDRLDGPESSSSVGGRPPGSKPKQIVGLHDIVTERAQASLQEIADELHRCGGTRVYGNDSPDATCARCHMAQASPQGVCEAGRGRQAI